MEMEYFWGRWVVPVSKGLLMQAQGLRFISRTCNRKTMYGARHSSAVTERQIGAVARCPAHLHVYSKRKVAWKNEISFLAHLALRLEKGVTVSWKRNSLQIWKTEKEMSHLIQVRPFFGRKHTKMGVLIGIRAYSQLISWHIYRLKRVRDWNVSCLVCSWSLLGVTWEWSVRKYQMIQEHLSWMLWYRVYRAEKAKNERNKLFYFWIPNYCI